jgi:hypothetical protein
LFKKKSFFENGVCSNDPLKKNCRISKAQPLTLRKKKKDKKKQTRKGDPIVSQRRRLAIGDEVKEREDEHRKT